MSGARKLHVEFAPESGPFDLVDGDNSLQTLETTEGTLGSGASAPDSVPLSITGDIDLRCQFSQGDTRLIASALFTKWNEVGDQKSWFLWISGGTIVLSWSADGATTQRTVNSIAIPDYDKPYPLAVRATLDVNNGAGGYDVAFYTADTIDGSWTQLGPTQTFAGTASIFNSTAVAQIGNWSDSTGATTVFPFLGRIYAAQALDGIAGTVVANPDFRIQTPGDTSFADTASSPNTWTVNAPAEIVGSDWVDVSDRVLSASWNYGRDDDLDPFPAGSCTVTLKNDDRVLDPDYTAGAYYGQLLPRVPFRLRSTWGSLRLAASAGAGFTTPDHASLAVTDLDVRVQVALDDWTPGGLGVILTGQWGSAGNESWIFGLTSAGNLTLIFTTDGTTDLTRTSTAVPGFTDGDDRWIRVTLDVNNGAAGHDVIFYTSLDGVTWTQLGTTVTTAGTVTLFNSTADLTVGSPVSGLDPTCDLRYVEVRSGIGGTVVASPDFLELEPGTTSFRDSTDKLWTRTGTAVAQIDTGFFTDEFYGFVENGWEQELRPPEGCNAVVNLVDRISALGGYLLPDVFDQSILIQDPVGYWVLDQSDNADVVADLGSQNNDGTVVGQVQFGQRPVVEGHSNSALFNAEFSLTEPNIMKNYVEITSGSPLVELPGSSSVVATFRARTAGTLNFHLLFVQSDGNTPALKALDMSVGLQAQLNFTWAETSGGISYDWTEGVVDGAGHIVFGQGDGIAVDTATLSTSTVTAPGQPGTNGVGIGSHGGINDEDNWDGWIGAVAVYDRLLTEPERSAILVGYEKLSGETSDVHVNWALDRLSVPPELRNFEVGSVVMGPANAKDTDALQWIRDVEQTEQGQFFSDHRDEGKFRYVDRYSRFIDDRSTVVQYYFSDSKTDTSPNLVRVERDDFDLVPKGIQGVVNRANVTWKDGTETISDDVSIARFGPRPRDVSTQATSPQVARSAGEWLVARYSQPQTRVNGVGIYPGGDRRGYRTAYHLQIGDRVQVRYHPQEVGDATTVECFVEGVEQSVERGVSWAAHYSLSPAPVGDNQFTPWIWGVSEWDETTYWG